MVQPKLKSALKKPGAPAVQKHVAWSPVLQVVEVRGYKGAWDLWDEKNCAGLFECDGCGRRMDERGARKGSDPALL